MTREHPEAHQLMAQIEADIERTSKELEQIETKGHDQMHGQLQAHLPKLDEANLDGWLKQANALHGVRERRRERTS